MSGCGVGGSVMACGSREVVAGAVMAWILLFQACWPGLLANVGFVGMVQEFYVDLTLDRDPSRGSSGGPAFGV